MAAVVYPFRQNLGAIAVAGQIAAGAATYGAVLLGCNFLNLRDSIVRKQREKSEARSEKREESQKTRQKRLRQSSAQEMSAPPGAARAVSDVTGPDALDAAQVHLAEAQMR